MVEQTMPAQEEPKVSGRRFIISLLVQQRGPALVRSCEIKGRTFNNRTSFGQGMTLDGALCQPLAQALQNALDGLSGKTEVLSLPEFLFESAGLMLRGIHIIATRLKDGAVNVIMRFLSFVGGINHAFAPQIGFDDPVEEEGQAIAASVLEDIAAPLLNICSTIHLELDGAHSVLGAFGERIASQTEEIRFRTHLLRRYVERRAGPVVSGMAIVAANLDTALINKDR